MATVQIREAQALLTVSGTNRGWITVADSTLFYPGAEVFLYSTPLAGALSQRAIITELGSGGTIGIRFLTEPLSAPSYGRSDCSAFLTTDAAYIFQPAQPCRVEQPTFVKIPVLP